MRRLTKMAKDGRTDIPSAQYKSNWNDIFGKPSKAEEKSKSNKTKGSKDEKGKGN